MGDEVMKKVSPIIQCSMLYFTAFCVIRLNESLGTCCLSMDAFVGAGPLLILPRPVAARMK